MKINNTEKKERKPNLWLTHVKSIRDKNPNLIYKDVLKLAKESYTPPEKIKKSRKSKSNEYDEHDEFTVSTKRAMNKAKKKLLDQKEAIEAY
jgi:hypothetical protein